MATNAPCSACQLAPAKEEDDLCISCRAEVNHADEHEWSKSIDAFIKTLNEKGLKRFVNLPRDDMKSLVVYSAEDESPKSRDWRYSHMH